MTPEETSLCIKLDVHPTSALAPKIIAAYAAGLEEAAKIAESFEKDRYRDAGQRAAAAIRARLSQKED